MTLRNGIFNKSKECESGIYCYDTTELDYDEATNEIHSMLQTTNNNKWYLTLQKISGADRA